MSKAKTMGIFEIKSRIPGNADFKLVGSSSQIEVCTRDYMTWCKKNKAPKTMQAEYDRASKLAGLKAGEVADPSAIFAVSILKACTTPSELEAAKTEFGLVKSFPVKKTAEATETAPLATAETAQPAYKINLDRPEGYKQSRDLVIRVLPDDVAQEQPAEPVAEIKKPVVPQHPVVAEYAAAKKAEATAKAKVQVSKAAKGAAMSKPKANNQLQAHG